MKEQSILKQYIDELMALGLGNEQIVGSLLDSTNAAPVCGGMAKWGEPRCLWLSQTKY